jgi:hypothetical protein
MKYIADLRDYETASPRLLGFKTLLKANLPIPQPIKIVNHKGFLDYRRKGMSEALQKEIEVAFLEIRKRNARKGVITRRAYLVPGLENPPGPRSAVIMDTPILIEEVKKIFDFAIKNKFDKEGSEITVFIHPYINPQFPSGGGCVTVGSYNGKSGIVIEAIFGNDEAVQSLPHDDYLVDKEKNKIIEKIIHYKPKYLAATEKMGYKTMTVPRKLRLVQVFDDHLILKVARDFRRLINLAGPQRVEFDVLPEGVFYIEAVGFEKKEEGEPMVQFSGKILRVKSLEDVRRIKKNNRLIFVDPKVVRERDMDLLTCLACNTPHRQTILYPGTATTAHAATIFREMGHTVVYVGLQDFEDNENVVIRIEEGELAARKQLLI